MELSIDSDEGGELDNRSTSLTSLCNKRCTRQLENNFMRVRMDHLDFRQLRYLGLKRLL